MSLGDDDFNCQIMSLGVEYCCLKMSLGAEYCQ